MGQMHVRMHGEHAVCGFVCPSSGPGQQQRPSTCRAGVRVEPQPHAPCSCSVQARASHRHACNLDLLAPARARPSKGSGSGYLQVAVRLQTWFKSSSHAATSSPDGSRHNQDTITSYRHVEASTHSALSPPGGMYTLRRCRSVRLDFKLEVTYLDRRSLCNVRINMRLQLPFHACSQSI